MTEPVVKQSTNRTLLFSHVRYTEQMTLGDPGIPIGGA